MTDYVTQNFILVFISTISYLNYLFPLSCFDDVVLSDTRLKTLNGNSVESRKLLEHIEKGIFKSVEKGLVNSILFYIYYELDDFDIFRLEIIHSKNKNKKFDTDFKKYILYNFLYLIKSLIDFLLNTEFTKSPDKAKYCSIKLIYNKNCTNLAVPQTFKPTAKLSHITSYNCGDDDLPFDTIFESSTLNAGFYDLKLKCERKRT